MAANVHRTCWPWDFEVWLPDHLAGWLSCSIENSRCPAAHCYKGGASFGECAQHCHKKRDDSIYILCTQYYDGWACEKLSILVLTIFHSFIHSFIGSLYSFWNIDYGWITSTLLCLGLSMSKVSLFNAVNNPPGGKGGSQIWEAICSGVFFWARTAGSKLHILRLTIVLKLLFPRDDRCRCGASHLARVRGQDLKRRGWEVVL